MSVLGSLKESGANIRRMDSPRSGLRRAAVASWALAGIGVAGVVGASALAYADTVKPPAAVPPEEASAPAPEDIGLPIVEPPPVSDSATPTDAPPPVSTPATTDPPPAPVAVPTPVSTEAPIPEYTPEQTYEPAPAPVTHATQAPTQAPTKVTTAPTTKRRVSTPSTVQSPNYSPHVTVSRGS